MTLKGMTMRLAERMRVPSQPTSVLVDAGEDDDSGPRAVGPLEGFGPRLLLVRTSTGELPRRGRLRLEIRGQEVLEATFVEQHQSRQDDGSLLHFLALEGLQELRQGILLFLAQEPRMSTNRAG